MSRETLSTASGELTDADVSYAIVERVDWLVSMVTSFLDGGAPI
jgi:hypothetical protein